MYKLICFDLDDTLWPCMDTIYRAEQTMYDWLAEHRPKITQTYSINQLREKRKQLVSNRPELGSDLSAARRAHLKQLADEFLYDDDWVEEAFLVFYEARQKVQLYDDVVPVLSALKTDYTLAALTNGNAHISKTGLGNLFDFQISAADVQAAKPSPLMFYRAMEIANASPEQTLHIGDHPTHDILGANNAGVDSVWIRRFEQKWDGLEAEPQNQFTNLQAFYEWFSA